MFHLQTHVDIAASAADVWLVLTDFEDFPEWNPFIRRIDGELAPGTRLRVRVQPPGGRAMTFRPTVLRVEPDRHFAWRGHALMPGIFDGEHAFTLEPRGTSTRLLHEERFGGVLLPLLRRSLDTTTRRGFEAMNDALKARVEQQRA